MTGRASSAIRPELRLPVMGPGTVADRINNRRGGSRGINSKRAYSLDARQYCLAATGCCRRQVPDARAQRGRRRKAPATVGLNLRRADQRAAIINRDTVPASPVPESVVGFRLSTAVRDDARHRCREAVRLLLADNWRGGRRASIGSAISNPLTTRAAITPRIERRWR